MGYHRAGFEVVGVDIKPQPRYPFRFIHDDALEFMVDRGDVWEWDAIHASPPCQAYTLHNGAKWRGHPDLIGPTRELLEATGLPYVIENVVGAPMRSAFTLCGSSFGLATWAAGEWRQLRRHRLFETNWPIGMLPPCAHRAKAAGVYGDHFRLGRRSSDGEFSGAEALRLGSDLMDINWMTWDELKEAIPPAYTEFLGEQLLAHVQEKSLSGERSA